MGHLISLKSYDKNKGANVEQWFDPTEAVLYADQGGKTRLRQLEPVEFLLAGDRQPVLEDGERIHVGKLANAAAEHMYGQAAALTGKGLRVAQLDSLGRLAHDDNGRLITMDLAVGDVHTNAALSNYAGGYHIADGIADAVSPVILVPKATDVFYTWNSSNDFNRKLGVATAAGAAVSMVNPTLAPTTYSTVQYGLGGFLTTEVQSNADTPLRPFTKLTQMIVDALRLEREIRVSTQLQTSGNWNAGLVTTILSGAQWNGGGASDPLAVIHAMEEASYMSLDALVWSTRLRHDFVRNPSIQKYFGFKDRTPGIPQLAQISSELGIPDIYEGTMKYTTGGTLPYVWGNHLVGLHRPKQNPPTDQMDVATAYTFRWNGGEAPDGTQTGGLLVRSYYDPKLGVRGSTVVVVTHNDIELQTSGLVGGLILNCHQ